MKVVLSPIGPSIVIPASEEPKVPRRFILSELPSFKENSNTELSELPRLTGKAPEYNCTSLIKSALIIPTGPPEAPCVAK